MSFHSPNASFNVSYDFFFNLESWQSSRQMVKKCTIYFPQILRWMFEQKVRFCFQVKGTQIELINNVLDVSCRHENENTGDVELKVN